jgi:hypothetical protein
MQWVQIKTRGARRGATGRDHADGKLGLFCHADCDWKDIFATNTRRTAGDWHRHFVPAQAKTDASACAWIAVDTKLLPVAVESA